MKNNFLLGDLLRDIKIPVTPNVFVSYHHRNDQSFYDLLSLNMRQSYTMVRDNSLDRQIDSDDAIYVMRKIREEYLTGTSCTIVLCGAETWRRKFVDWEIMATLEKQHALVGLRLPTLPIYNNGCTKPARLQDNIDSGFAAWGWYSDVINIPLSLATLVHEARARSKALINNSRPRQLRNS